MEFRDLKAQYYIMKDEIDTAVEKVIQNANFISGLEVKELEQQLCEYIGCKHCITCANGTDALILALMAWGIGTGDAVFVPDFTFFASGEAPAFLGATPVFVDVEKDTFNISCEELENAIKNILIEGKLVPKVIIAVDLFGQPANYREIRLLAKKYGLKILEDGAQGFGGSINEKKACGFGDISTTSFFPAKPLGCYGDGGAIFTNNDEWNQIIRSLCVHGKGKDKYDNRYIGMNSRLDTMQAAILKVKLKHFIQFELDNVNKVANWYNKKLKEIVKTPCILNNYISSWAQYTVICKDKNERDILKNRLQENDIPSMIYYVKGMHQQEAFRNKAKLVGEYINTEYLSERVLSLPIHPYMKEKDIDLIVQIIKNK